MENMQVYSSNKGTIANVIQFYHMQIKNLSTELPDYSLDYYKEELTSQTAKTCVSVSSPFLFATHLK